MVTEKQIPSKTELLEALRSSGQEVLTKLRELPAEKFEEGRYEGGWNARQILAHVASIEWTYPRLLGIAEQAPASGTERTADPARNEPGESSPPTRTAQGGIISYNERQVEKRAQTSVDDLLEEFQTNRAATIAAVKGASDALLSTPIRSAGGITGALAGVINSVAVLHVRAHLGDILGED